MSNIVFFGQADAGKSTLAGYLIAKYDMEFRLSKFIKSMEKSSADYDSRLAFSSIVNTNRDEVSDAAHLNSRSLHLRKINLPFDDVTIIDTPGSERYSRQRERGMYYGNVGIFFAEINNILQHKYMENTLAPIVLWSKFKNKRMIFLLTKFDTVDYKEEAYRSAFDEINIISQWFGFDLEEISVIPTAIEVDRLKNYSYLTIDNEEFGENIIRSSEKMPWYNGPCLIDAIKNEINELDGQDQEEPLMFCVTDQVEYPSSSAGKVWNIKILSGMLKVGDVVTIAPIKDKNNYLGVLKATIKSIRSDISRFDEETKVRIARKGEICGINISDCYLDNKRKVAKTEIDAVSSSCGFTAGEQYDKGERFLLRVEEEPNAFIEGREMKLVWFGRILPFFVDVVELVNGAIHVSGRLKSTEIALPKEGRENVSENVLVKGDGLQDFYNGRLIRIW